MAQNETWLNHDLLEAVQVQYLDGNLFSQDNSGNLIGVLLTRDGVPYAGGGSVSANVIRADGATVAVVGALSGNAATVVLSQAAYAVPGVVSIVVKLTVSGEVTTIAAVVANVYQSSTDSVVDPGTIIPSVQTLIAAIDAAVASIPADYSSLWTSLAPAFSTSVNYTAGQYVTYNGAVYRFTVDHPAGAWNSAHVTATNIGSELNSLKSAIDDMIAVTVGENLTNPAELYGATIDNTTGAINPDNYYVCSGHIPCTPGETLYILWYVRTNDIRARKTEDDKLAFYREDGTFISIGYNEDSYTVPELAAYCIQQGYKALTEANTVAVFRVPASSLGGRWLYYTETRTLEYSYTPQDVLDRLNTIDDCMKTNDYLDYSMVNRLDPADCKIGKGVDLYGNEYDNASVFATDYLEIRQGETLYFFRKDGIENNATNRYAAFDKNKNALPSLGQVARVSSIEQTGDMAYVRVTFIYYESDIYRTPQGISVIATNKPPFIPGYGGMPVIKSGYLRKVINIYSTDSESQIIQKLVNAYNIGNCDVFFERADYTFGTELEKVNTDYGVQHNEIPIGNNCRYYFNGAVLTATIDLSQHPAAEGEDEFYCNFFGCQRLPSSYELHDGVLIATDTRYVVHDESSALAGSYKHLYQNMEMHYHTNRRQEAIRKCIGGGTGASGVVEIVGCKFTTDGTDSCVSFHGNGTDVVGAEFDLNVRDSWFSNNIRGGTLSAHQTARMFYTGNSAIGEPAVYDRWTVTKFLNEVRN